MSQFKLLSSCLAFDTYPIKIYKSMKTGISIVITNAEKPTVDCSFLIVVEPENDSGYIHALEHLILNGSEQYPQRGTLSKLADDVCCWSGIDHTIQKFTSGEQYSTLLPIFLNQVMFPTLCDEDFLLDIHHIDGEGEHGGLVYKEIENVDCNPFYKGMTTKFLKEMCPNSSYSFDFHGTETGLRTATNSQVKEFHKKYYRPENITILFTGKINEKDVFEKLAAFEDELMAKRSVSEWNGWKPWQGIPSPPNYGVYDSFHTHPDDEDEPINDYNMIIGWRGPVLSTLSSMKEMLACEILLDYLTVLHSAPLRKCLINSEKQLAKIVSHNIDSQKVSLLRLEIFDIAQENVEEVQLTVMECIRNIRHGITDIDMERIQILVEEELDGYLSSSTDTHHDVTMRYLSYLYLDESCLVSSDDNHFSAVLNPQWQLKELLQEDSSYWLQIFKKYYTEDVVIVVSHPLKDKVIKKERDTILKEKSAIGKKELAANAELLKNAKAFRQNSSIVVN